MTGKNSRRQNNGSWQRAALESVLQEVGAQPLQTYIDRRQAIVAEWVELSPIFEVCVKEMGYKGGGVYQEPWWRQVVDNKHLRDMLEDILEATRDRQRHESIRYGGCEGCEEETDSNSNG